MVAGSWDVVVTGADREEDAALVEGVLAEARRQLIAQGAQRQELIPPLLVLAAVVLVASMERDNDLHARGGSRPVTKPPSLHRYSAQIQRY